MQVMKAVVLDLAQFALAAVSRKVRRLLPARQKRLALPGVTHESPALLAPISVPLTVVELHASTRPLHEQRHFVGVGDAVLYIHPTVTFDSAITSVPYGAEVLVHRFENRFASVTYGEYAGWMLKDTLHTEIDAVLPRFVVGLTYHYEDENTEKVRNYIHDAFSGGAAHAPLASVEYVTYRLLRVGHSIPWGATRPRVAGSWQRLLKGVRGVYSGIVPKTGSIMEYETEGVGVVAYVEAVAPDETIRISMILDDDNARYLEQELTKESWRELRPVFISIV